MSTADALAVPSNGVFEYLYYPDEQHAECLERYRPGGCHPIVVGDILSSSQSSSYRIVQKLGWGSFSTVWLAEKATGTHGFYAVKVSTAQGYSQREKEVLRAIPAGATNLPRFVDAFDLTGPNGLHSVVVTAPVVVPFLSLQEYPSLPGWLKYVAHGLVKAVSQLHAAGIVHGDIHAGNVGLSLPHLEHATLEDLEGVLDDFRVTIVLPEKAIHRTSHVPPYILEPLNLARYYHETCGSEPPQAQLLDFGNASIVGTPSGEYHCFTPCCAPELLLARIVDEIQNPIVEPPADVWALGTLIYEIYAARPLFSINGETTLAQCMSLVEDGEVPQSWAAWPKKPGMPLDAAAWWSKCRDTLQAKCPDDFEGLLLMLRCIFVCDSARRVSARDLLSDDWFAGLV